MQPKFDDPKLNARVEMLGNTDQAQALEQMLRQILSAYLKFYSDNGMGPLIATVSIQQRVQEPATLDPTQELRQQQMLESLAKDYRRYKQAKRRNDMANGLRVMLAGMPIGGRGH